MGARVTSVRKGEVMSSYDLRARLSIPPKVPFGGRRATPSPDAAPGG